MSRALRRHHAKRAFARRRFIVTTASAVPTPEEWISHRILTWHLRCHCWEFRATRMRRRRENREWRQFERSAW